MKSTFSKPFYFLTSVLILLSCTGESLADWQVILDENFNRNLNRDPWPWETPGGYAWHYNTLRWPGAERNLSNCGWGVQDYMFNDSVTVDDNYQNSLWCALSTQNGPNSPQRPDLHYYWNGANGWAWWGPFDLSRAETARLIFWVLMDNEDYTNDSLSVVAVNDPDLLTSNGDLFREQVGIALSLHEHHEHDENEEDVWQLYEVFLEELQVNGEDASYLGEEEVWIAFVWQSDEEGAESAGALIDDIILGWDDGLFEISPVNMEFGYQFHPDSINWHEEIEQVYDEVYLRLNYRMGGSEEITPAFTIDCYVDDELFYTEDVESTDATEDFMYSCTTDTIWRVPTGEHTIRWELDTPIDEGGIVEETDEENNVFEYVVDLGMNEPPLLTILTPAGDSTLVRIGEEYWINWSVSDPNEEDESFEVNLYWTTDTTGWYRDRNVILNWNVIRGEGTYGPGEHHHTCAWNDTIGTVIYIAGFASDFYFRDFDMAPGTILLVDPAGVSDPVTGETVDYNLIRAFPNPFNNSISIEFSIPVLSQVQIVVHDLAGRQVAELVNNRFSTGIHTCIWMPGEAPGGVYMLKLETRDRSFIRKVVYIP
ncbi:T9SS type A sorting domain-containing protein [bacterium]|nr:T9SS type A sorting domain-containing protein [bacterium]